MSVEAQDTSTGQQPSQTKQTITSYIGIFRSAATNIAALIAVLTVLGFWVLQGYLSSVTNINAVSIDVRQYLIAGGNLAINFFSLIGSPIILFVLGYFAIVGVFFWFGVVRTQPMAREIDRGRWVWRIQRGFDIFELNGKKFLRWFALFMGIVGIFITAALYGTFLYPLSPAQLGGGAPSRIILVFDAPQADAGWPFGINPQFPAQSQPIDLIMQLTDGVLVRDPNNPVPVIVKSDIVRAIIDANPRTQPSVTPTAVPPTATP